MARFSESTGTKMRIQEHPTRPCEDSKALYFTRLGYPLKAKVFLSQMRIREWYNHWGGQVYVSFSGGKDSTVLLHMVRELFPEVEAVFVDTGLEYPEIRKFIKTINNVTWVRPAKKFKDVIEEFGYPVVSKDQACAITRYQRTQDPVQKYRRIHGWPKGLKGTISKKWRYLLDAPFDISDKCCKIMKKDPLDAYVKVSGKHPLTGMMASESNNRKMQYWKQGCNAFDNKKPISWPMAFWTDKNVWAYIKDKGLSYSKIYDMGETRTGCVFCAFGTHREESPNRFQRMARTHPKLHKYCTGADGLNLREVLSWVGVSVDPDESAPKPPRWDGVCPCGQDNCEDPSNAI